MRRICVSSIYINHHFNFSISTRLRVDHRSYSTVESINIDIFHLLDSLAQLN